MRNWAGNREIRAGRIHLPTSIDELQELVRATPRIRAIGSRHSFNDLADADVGADGSPGDLVSLELLPRRIEVRPDQSTVVVDGGARYGDVVPALDAAGAALGNLASLPHISIAGACCTGTHGSGDANPAMSAEVAGVELIGGDGERRWIRDGSEDDLPLQAAVVSLGAVGIVTALELRTVPAFDVAQTVYEGLATETYREHVEEVASLAYSVSAFTSWRGRIDQVWLKRRTNDAAVPATVFGARPARVARHPIEGFAADSCTPQLGVSGPWHARLPHFRLDHVPSAGNELQSEYVVPRAQLVPAFRAIEALGDSIAPLVYVSEIRTIAADDGWLSMASGRASAAFHFTWRPDWPAVREVLPRIETALAPFEPRPHWGKLFTTPWDDVRARYPRLPEFERLVRRIDPDGKFANQFVRGLLQR